jgi:hypothetical protein
MCHGGGLAEEEHLVLGAYLASYALLSSFNLKNSPRISISIYIL